MAVTMETPDKMTRNEKIKWALTIILPLLIMLVPTSETFTEQIRLFFAITMCAIFMFAFELMDVFVPSLALPVVYVLSGLATLPDVFAPWSASTPWMMVGALLFAEILDQVGVLKRVAYWCIMRTGGSFKGLLYGIMVAGIALSLVMPGSTVVPLATLSYGICRTLKIPFKSKAAGTLMLVTLFAGMNPGGFFYNVATGMLCNMASTVTPVSVSWLGYFVHNIPIMIWCFILVFITDKTLNSKYELESKDIIKQEYHKLGKMSLAEKKLAVLAIALVAFLVTNSIHKIDIAWGFLLIACISLIPGLRITNQKEILTKFDMNIVVFITATMSIGAVANLVGAGKFVSNGILPLLGEGNTTIVMGIIWILAVVVNFILTPFAAMASLTVPLTDICVNIGIDPLIMIYAFMQGLDQLLLPYESVFVLVVFSFGLINMKDGIKVLAVKMALNFVFVILVCVPYWKWIVTVIH